MLSDEDEEAAPTAAAKSQTSQQPAWMRTLLERCREWLNQLPAVRILHYPRHLVLTVTHLSRNSARWRNSLETPTHCIACFPVKVPLDADFWNTCEKTLQMSSKFAKGSLSRQIICAP